MENTKTYPFLSGNSEAVKLIQVHNWDHTIVGPIEKWPQSLRTALSIILESAFPMLLFWGKDLITFYNDAYATILETDNRHPAIGKKAPDIWPEGWEKVRPLLEKVLYNGEIVHFEDLLIPVYRNGQLQDVYWTFRYSPFYGDSEKIVGIIVSCAETTEKVNNYKHLQESKEELEFAIEATELGTWEVNPQTQKLKTNNRLKEWFGLEPHEEVLLSSATDNIIEEDRQRVMEAINEALNYRSGGHYDVEYTIENPLTKQRRIVRAKGRSWFNEDNVAYRFNGTLQDVTQQVESRKKIEQSEQRFRTLVEEAIVSTAILTGPELVLELANDAMLKIWGRDKSIIGKPLLEFMPELKDQPFPKILANVFETGEAYIAEDALVVLERNGKLEDVYMDFSYKPLTEEAGKVLSILVMATDVTERVKSSKQLRQSEENLRNTILKAPVAMAIFKGEKFVTEIANEKMLQLWGKKEEDIIGLPTFESMPEMKEQGFDKVLETVYTTGNAYSDQGVPVQFMRWGKLDVVYLNFVFEPYRDTDGAISGIIVVAIDVTDQVQARQKIEEIVQERTNELEAANKNLEQSNAALEQFAYITSHDLQEPVRKISIFSKMLEGSFTELDERQSSYISKIKSAADRMTNLIKDVLLYSRVSKGGDKLEETDLARIIAETLTDYELLIEQSNAKIQYKDLPVVDAIPLQMVQLFSNLISNSLKYIAPDVNPFITIETSLLPKEEYMQYHNLNFSKNYHKIEFKDNGIGFEPEYAEKIFNIFQRLHTKSEYTGTGVGLAICKKIMENHFGDITAAPRPEGGAVFKIVIPVKQ